MSDSSLDFALVGEGLFAIESADGERRYTRDGSFAISLEGGNSYLTDGLGNYVLDGNGARIVVPTEENSLQLDTTALREVIGVYNFTNPYGLSPAGDNGYHETIKSGVPTGGSLDSSGIGMNDLIQGALEYSTVDMADQMVEIMNTQRGFSLTSKIVQAADQMEEIVNTLR